VRWPTEALHSSGRHAEARINTTDLDPRLVKGMGGRLRA